MGPWKPLRFYYPEKVEAFLESPESEAEKKMPRTVKQILRKKELERVGKTEDETQRSEERDDAQNTQPIHSPTAHSPNTRQPQQLNETPSRSFNETPSRSFNETPSRSFNETPSKSFNETPSNPTKETPSRSFNETPSKSFHETPSNPTKETPSVSPASSKSSSRKNVRVVLPLEMNYSHSDRPRETHIHESIEVSPVSPFSLDRSFRRDFPPRRAFPPDHRRFPPR